jgi:hypothetical protein
MNVKKASLNDTEIYAFSNWVFVDGVPGPGPHRWAEKPDITVFEFLFDCLDNIKRTGGTILLKGDVAHFHNLNSVFHSGRLYSTDLVEIGGLTLTVDEFDHYRNEW